MRPGRRTLTGNLPCRNIEPCGFTLQAQTSTVQTSRYFRLYKRPCYYAQWHDAMNFLQFHSIKPMLRCQCFWRDHKVLICNQTLADADAAFRTLFFAPLISCRAFADDPMKSSGLTADKGFAFIQRHLRQSPTPPFIFTLVFVLPFADNEMLLIFGDWGIAQLLK